MGDSIEVGPHGGFHNRYVEPLRGASSCKSKVVTSVKRGGDGRNQTPCIGGGKGTPEMLALGKGDEFYPKNALSRIFSPCLSVLMAHYSKTFLS
eukprot:scaffold155_cov347-Pavlova_lutheri.AAC.44